MKKYLLFLALAIPATSHAQSAPPPAPLQQAVDAIVAAGGTIAGYAGAAAGAGVAILTVIFGIKSAVSALKAPDAQTVHMDMEIESDGFFRCAECGKWHDDDETSFMDDDERFCADCYFAKDDDADFF